MPPRSTFRFFAFALIVASGFACVRQPDVPTLSSEPLEVNPATVNVIDCDEGPASFFVESPNLVPEGIEYDPELCRFLLGSISEGNILAVADDGSFSALTNDDELGSSTGIHLDGRRLLVCAELANGSPGFGIYNADDGSRIQLVNLSAVAGGGSHLINDCTADEDGNAYVTDSQSNKIYRVTPDGNASVFLEDDTFSTSGVGLNGIEFIADENILVVGVTALGKLYRIPLDDPSGFSEIGVGGSVSIDGMLLHPSGNLIYVGGLTFNNPPNNDSFTGVFAIRGENNWTSAKINGFTETSIRGTTAALRGTDVYVSFAFIADFFTGTTVERYPIVKVATEEGAVGFAKTKRPD